MTSSVQTKSVQTITDTSGHIAIWTLGLIAYVVVLVIILGCRDALFTGQTDVHLFFEGFGTWTFIIVLSYCFKVVNGYYSELEDWLKKLKSAEGPRLTPFVILDKKLPPDSQSGTRYVLEGYVFVHNNGCVTASDRLHLRTIPYEPDIHDHLLKAPFYKPSGRDPRTGDRLIKILGEYYTY